MDYLQILKLAFFFSANLIAQSGRGHSIVDTATFPRTISSTLSQSQQAADQLLTQFEGSPGCSVSVISNGRILYEGARGLSNTRLPIQQSQTPQLGVTRPPQAPRITTRTKFLLASVTKPLVALTIMKIRERTTSRLGEPDLLDRSLSSVFSNLRFADPAIGGITIRQLMSHTSGLFRGVSNYRPHLQGELSDSNILRALSRMRPEANGLGAQRGSFYLYSNVGYAVLGAVIERLTGQSLSGAMEELVFSPLQMSDTSISHPRNYERDQRMATAYEFENNRWIAQPLVDSLSGTLGDGGAVTSAHDMSKLAIELEKVEDGTSTFLRRESLQEVFRIPFDSHQGVEERTNGRTIINQYLDEQGQHVRSQYGLGFTLFPRQQSETTRPTTTYRQWHGGSYGGYRTLFSRITRQRPPCRLAITILCNRGPLDPNEAIGNRLEEIFCPR